MKAVTWTLLSCPHHIDLNGASLTGPPQEVSLRRGGCNACRIVLTCDNCRWETRHALWSSAEAAAAFHQEAQCRV